MTQTQIEIDVEDMVENHKLECRNKTFFITGATGMMGEYLVKYLMRVNDLLLKTQRNHIIALVRNYEKAKRVFAEYWKRDDLQIMVHSIDGKFIYDGKIDYVIHTAGIANIETFRTNPTSIVKANVLGTYNIFESIRDRKVTSMLFVSSASVYGSVDDVPLMEECVKSHIQPSDYRNVYAESKRMGEMICASYYKEFGIPVKIVRPFIIYGPNMPLNNGGVLADFFSNILNNEDIILKSQGIAKRNLCYITDTIEAFFTVLFKGQNGEAYNVGGEESTVTIKELAIAVSNLRKKNIVEEPNNNRKMPTNYFNMYPDINKLKALGWQSRVNLQIGLENVLKSLIEVK